MIRMVFPEVTLMLCFKYADPENLATLLVGDIMFRGNGMLPRLFSLKLEWVLCNVVGFAMLWPGERPSHYSAFERS